MLRLLVRLVLPFVASWISRQERRISRHGIPLNSDELRLASALEVAHPERVRVLHVQRVPLPGGFLSRAAAGIVKRFPSEASGLTARYGIFLLTTRGSDRSLLAHELAHVRQYERLGGIRPFLKLYLTECLTEGYHAAPLELDAAARAAEILTCEF